MEVARGKAKRLGCQAKFPRCRFQGWQLLVAVCHKTGIQPADGWAWWQSARTAPRMAGCRGRLPLTQVQRMPSFGRDFQGRHAFETGVPRGRSAPSGEGHCAAMYNLAIQAFSLPGLLGSFYRAASARLSPRPPRQPGAFRVIVLIRVKKFVRNRGRSRTRRVHGTIQIRGEGFQS